jgi:hypothetical protein
MGLRSIYRRSSAAGFARRRVRPPTGDGVAAASGEPRQDGAVPFMGRTRPSRQSKGNPAGYFGYNRRYERAGEPRGGHPARSRVAGAMRAGTTLDLEAADWFARGKAAGG